MSLAAVPDATGMTVSFTTALGVTSQHGFHVLPDGREQSTATSASGAVATVLHDTANAAFVSTAADGTVSTTTSAAAAAASALAFRVGQFR